MERITTEEKYNEKVEAFKLVYNDESVSMEEKFVCAKSLPIVNMLKVQVE